jgi:hypothetical protein
MNRSAHALDGAVTLPVDADVEGIRKALLTGRSMTINEERTLFGAITLWVIALAWWLFLGSGYAEIAPEAYRVTTTALLAGSNTAVDATAILKRDGYINIIEQRHLMQRLVPDQ